jgi:putative Holliday junction resolvase
VRSGVRLACDVGSVRIGVARSDATGILAVPLDAIPAGETSVDAVVALVSEWEALEV